MNSRNLSNLVVRQTCASSLILLSCFVACNKNSQAKLPVQQSKDTEMNDSTNNNSTPKQVTVIFPSEGKVQKIDAVASFPTKDETLKAGANGPDHTAIDKVEPDFPLDVFVLPDSSHAWIGVQADGYIMLDSEIYGVDVHGGIVAWRRSMVATARSNNELLEALPSYAEVQKSLMAANNERTDIRFVFEDRDFFAAGPLAANNGKISVREITLDDGLIKIEIENLTTSRKGNVWINPDTKLTVKATENGKQTFNPSDEFADTAKLRRACCEATTMQTWIDAKAALIESLKTRFSGIDAKVTGSEADRHGKTFSDLMMEWNPIRFSPNDLKAIAGVPTSETAGELRYDFDNGMDGSYWMFKFEGDTIVSVTYTPGD